MLLPPDELSVLAAPDSSVGAALRAALTVRGWTVTAATGRAAPGRLVVVVEDDAGRPWSGWPAPGRRMVAVGSLRSAPALSVIAAAGGVVLNQEQPLPALLQSLERALRSEPPLLPARDARAVRVLRRRAEERRVLAQLSPRERDVLCGLLQGLAAAAIAERESRSVATVRSQIQSLTRRLGVTSQLAAVAMVHRSGRHAGLGDCLGGLHQF